MNGAPLAVRTVSVGDPIASLIGATPLRPEESKNYSAGTVISFGSTSFSVDYYKIKIEDRIALSSNFSSPALTGFLAANGAPGISAVAYLTNAVDTTTQGVDLTLTQRFDLGTLGDLRATLATTISDTEFDRISGTPPALAAIGLATPLFDLTQQIRFTQSIPRDKGTLALFWEKGPFTATLGTPITAACLRSR